MLGAMVVRRRLLRMLQHTSPFVVLEAGPGFGKTTLVRQWEREDPRTFVHTTADSPDLGLHLAALRRQRDERTPGFVLIVDRVERACDADELWALANEPIGEGSTVAFAGREIGPRLATRLRLTGALVQIGEADLAFTGAEAEAMLGSRVGPLEAEELVRATRGWPAGLRLALVAAVTSADSPPAFTGADRGVRDYVRTEILGGLESPLGDLLRDCAVIGPVSGPLCDAVLERDASAAALAALDRRNLFLRRADAEGRRYEWHPLVREALAAELVQSDPERARRLRIAAAHWHREHDAPADAIGLLVAAGDRDEARRLLAAVVLPLFESGRIDEIVELIHVLGPEEAEGDRRLADLLSLAGIMTGDERCAADWGRVAQSLLPAGDPEEEAAYRVMRGHLAPEGVPGMVADAAAGVRVLPPASRWVPPMLMMQGTAALLAGAPEAAAVLDDAIHLAAERGSLPALTLSLAERAIAAETEGRAVHARELVDRAIALASRPELTRYPQSALPFALRAADCAHRGRLDEARAALARAVGYGGIVGRSMPWLAVQLRTTVARAAVVLGDATVLRRALDEADLFVALLPEAGVLPAQVAAVRHSAAALLERTPWSPRPLSSAELRLLPLLASHLSLEQIALRLHVSKNTVKTQTGSIYRKLGVGARGEAVDQALELGLLSSPSPALAP